MADCDNSSSVRSRGLQYSMVPSLANGSLQTDPSDLSQRTMSDESSHQSYMPLRTDDGEAEEGRSKVHPSITHEVKERILHSHPRSDTNEYWSAKSQSLQGSGFKKYGGLFLDLTLTTIPATFLVFGFCAISLDQKPQSDYGSSILEGLKFGPSIFPIVFAAIVGQMMRRIAQWNVERGATLGLLEHLVGSQSIFSTIQRMVMLERYGIYSIITVLIWLLSPLGGQSSLRILELKSSTVQSSDIVFYLDVRQTGLSRFQYSFENANAITSVDAAFQASLLSSTHVKASPVDAWNNVKIPMLDDLSPWSPERPGNPWIALTGTPSTAAYAALNGITIVGLNETGKSEFNIQTSYTEFQCSDGKTYNWNTDSGYKNAFPYNLSVHNMSDPFNGPMSGSAREEFSTFFFDYGQNAYHSVVMNNDSLEEVQQIYMLYGTLLDEGAFEPQNPMMLFNCSVSTSYVEAAVVCNGPSCAVEKVRRWTPLDSEMANSTPYANSSVLNQVCEFLDFSTGSPQLGLTTPLELYVRGDDTPFTHDSPNDILLFPTVPPISQVDTTVIARRLSILFNTAWQISLAPFVIPIGTSVLPRHEDYGTAFNINEATAIITVEIQLYRINKVFICIFLFTAFLLQIFAVIGLILKLSCTGPDILGYVSTQTRDNHLFPELAGGSVLDGLERARSLRNMKVQLSDIQPDQAVGHISFTRAGESAGQRDKNVGVERGRHYL